MSNRGLARGLGFGKSRKWYALAAHDLLSAGADFNRDQYFLPAQGPELALDASWTGSGATVTCVNGLVTVTNTAAAEGLAVLDLGNPAIGTTFWMVIGNTTTAPALAPLGAVFGSSNSTRATMSSNVPYLVTVTAANAKIRVGTNNGTNGASITAVVPSVRQIFLDPVGRVYGDQTELAVTAAAQGAPGVNDTTFTNNGGVFTIARGTGAQTGYPGFTFATVAGRKYRVTATVGNGVNTTLIVANPSTAAFSSTTFDYSFVATSTTASVGFYPVAAPATSVISSISVKEAADQVVNGDFAQNPGLGSDLVNTASWVMSPGAGVATNTAGTLAVSGGGAGDQQFTTVANEDYELAFSVAGSGVAVQVGTTQGATGIVNNPGANSGASYVTKFRATGTTTWVRFLRTGASPDAVVSAITLKQVTNRTALGWQLSTGNGSGSAAISGGVLSLTGDGTNQAYADQSFATPDFASSPVYELTWTVGATNPAAMYIGNSVGVPNITQVTTTGATVTIKIIPTGATTWVRFFRQGTGTATVDNVSLKRITAFGKYPKRSATFAEWFAYTASSTGARTYTDQTGVLQDMRSDTYLGTDILSAADMGFDAGYTWSLNAAAAITGSQLVITSQATGATSSSLSVPLTVGTEYAITYTLISCSGGSVSPHGGATSYTPRNTPGTYTEYFTATGSSTPVGIQPRLSTVSAVIDNFRVRPVTSVNLPRFTYANGKRQLRLEDLRSNIWLSSDAPSWGVSGQSAVANTTVTAPNGALAGLLVTANGSNGIFAPNLTATAATAYTASFWLRGGTQTALRLSFEQTFFGDALGARVAVFNTATGTFTSTDAALTARVLSGPNTNGWYRVSITATSGATPVSGSSNTVYASGAGTYNVYGVQLELGAFASDYIPTTTAAATRNIETAEFSKLNEAIMQRAQGSVVVRGKLDAGQPGNLRVLGTVATNAPALIQRESDTTASSYNGTDALGPITLGSGSFSGGFGAVYAFDAAGRALAANGTVSQNTGGSGDRSQVYLARAATVNSGAPFADGYYDFVGISPERLTNAQLQTIAVAAS